MKLCRSRDDRQMAGVCGGLAKHFDLPASKLRVVWVLGTLFSAAFPGVLLYLALWYLLPEEPPPAPSFEPPPLQP
jgi:phage shock protein PspC (stress-responsive transcriptional regulator)